MNAGNAVNSPAPGSENSSLINFQAVTVDPIGAFYGKIAPLLPRLVDGYLASMEERARPFVGSQQDLENKISENERAVAERFAFDRVKKRRTQNAWIKFAFWLLFLGFIWWRKYKENKRVIADYEAFAAQKDAENRGLRGQVGFLSQTMFSTCTVEDAIEGVAREIGLPFVNCATPLAQQIVAAVEPGFVDIKTAFTFIYKNTPFTDLLYRTHSVRPVTTSASITVPYRIRTRDGYITGFETLTGYHSENTPFVDVSHALIAPTNFKPDAVFWTERAAPHVKKKKRRAERAEPSLFENPQFNEAISVRSANSGPEDEQALLQFFTIKAQEDFANWTTQWDANAAQLFKRGTFINTLPRAGEDAQPFLLREANDMFALHQAVQGAVTVDACREGLKAHLVAYFDDLLRRMQVPLLSPVINQEFWRENGQYLISNFKETVRPEDEKMTHEYVLSRLFKAQFFSFLRQTPHKPCWFQTLSERMDGGFVERDLMLRSYRGEHREDFVTVSGVNVGPHTIRVPYTEYFPIQERKRVAFAMLEHPQIYANTKFALGRNLLPFTFMPLFGDGALGNLASSMGLWTNAPDSLLADDRQELLRRAGELTDENLSLYRDEYGVYIVANDPLEEDADPDARDAFEMRFRKLKGIAREMLAIGW